MSDPWAPFSPSADAFWDLRKVAHLHLRAGFGGSWTDLKRDLDAGPEASVDRLLAPPVESVAERQATGKPAFDAACTPL